jgi:membrane fusion protein (multidrug efflux system)
MKRSLFIIIVLVIVSLLALPKIFGNKKNGQPAAGGKPQGPTPVGVQVAAPANMQDKVSVGGSLMANEQVDIIAEVPGKVTGIFFKEGAKVSKGQQLIKINDDELRAQLAKLQVNLQLSKDVEHRQKILLNKGGISQQEYDIALTQMSSTEEDIKGVQAKIAKTSISAPFSGIIGLRYVSEGSYLSPNTKISTLVNSDPLKIDFSVPEKYAATIKPGQTVKFALQGADTSYIASVYATDPNIDETTRTLHVRAIYPNPDGALLPGSFARVEMMFSALPTSVAVPAQAIVPVLKGQKVFIVKNGVAEERMVQTGIRTDQLVEITEGLAAGDSVVTQGLMQLKPGAKVMVIGNKSKEGIKK